MKGTNVKPFVYRYYIMIKSKCQEEILIDKSSTGKTRPWAVQRLAADYIAMAYDFIDENKAARMRECAQWLSFVRTEQGGLKLHDARFCRVRLCPICQWRRSLKTAAQMYKIIDVAERQGYKFIFLTLTVKNCSGSDLDTELTHVIRAFNKLSKYKKFADCVHGYYRGTEITYNKDTNEYHPHLHCILAVKPSYFSGRLYLSQNAWTELWKKALGVDYTPIVNIKKCYGGGKSVAEACKYCVKPSEMLQLDDWDMTVDVVRTLDAAVANRRFIGLGGIFKDIHKALQLDDMEDGDLVHMDEKEAEERKPEEIFFFWNGFRKNYFRGSF